MLQEFQTHLPLIEPTFNKLTPKRLQDLFHEA